ncbi:MAG: helix-turn-helix domain-containing protein [Candidatus Aenigmatarchaeota archaeon]
MAKLIDNGIIYDAKLVSADGFSVLNSRLAWNILQEFAKEPGCAMDIARRLNMHEQKIYYHLKRLERGGLIKRIGKEKRQNFTANIYTISNPVIAAKIAEIGRPAASSIAKDTYIEQLVHPFISLGKMNSLLIIGDPYPHGRYGAAAHHGVHVTDFALFLGMMLSEMRKINYKLDTQVKDDELRQNIIIIGGPKVNVIADRLNPHLPIYLEPKLDWQIVSRLTGNRYHGDTDAYMLKIKNPFNKDAWLLLLAGRRSIGLRTAVLAFINHTKEILQGNIANPSVIAKIVTGIDRDGDGIIDDVEFLE